MQELVAAEWVGMLKHGVLDADIYPEKATVIIDMLWSVTTNPSAQVSTCSSHAACDQIISLSLAVIITLSPTVGISMLLK